MDEENKKKFSDALTDIGISFILSAIIWTFFLLNGERGLIEFSLNILLHALILFFIFKAYKNKNAELASNIALMLLIAFIIIVMIILYESYLISEGQHFAAATPAFIGIWESYKAMNLFKSIHADE